MRLRMPPGRPPQQVAASGDSTFGCQGETNHLKCCFVRVHNHIVHVHILFWQLVH